MISSGFGKGLNVFLTGVTGLIGRHILYELLEKYDAGEYIGKIFLLVRANKNESPFDRLKNLLAGEKVPGYLKQPDIQKLLSHIRIIQGSLCNENLKEELRAAFADGTDTYVIHAAASTNLFSSTKSQDEIYHTNYLGTLNLIRALPQQVKKFIYISTAFSCGIRSGNIENDYFQYSSTEFRNPYESFKAKTEREITEICKTQGIACQILRPSVVCGRLLEKPHYYTSKFDVFYGWTKFFHRMKQAGKIENIRIQINKSGGMNIIPVDYVSKAIVRAMCAEIEQLNIVHTHSVSHTQYLARALNAVNFDTFQFVEETSEKMNKSEMLYYRSVAPAFNPYINCPKFEFNTSELRKLMHDIPEPIINENMGELISYAVKMNFGEPI